MLRGLTPRNSLVECAYRLTRYLDVHAADKILRLISEPVYKLCLTSLELHPLNR